MASNDTGNEANMRVESTQSQIANGVNLLDLPPEELLNYVVFLAGIGGESKLIQCSKQFYNAFAKHCRARKVKYFEEKYETNDLRSMWLGAMCLNDTTDYANLYSLNPGFRMEIVEGDFELEDRRSETLTWHDLVIPIVVTAIGDNSFSNGIWYSYGLQNLIIGESVTTIGGCAFRGNKLTTLVLPDSLKSIGYEAFKFNEIDRLTIGKNVTSIGYDAFEGNKLTTLALPDSVKSIGYGAFWNNKIEQLTLGKNVTSIGICAFSYNELTTLVLPDSLKSIGNGAFQCNKIDRLTLGKNVTSIGKNAFHINKLKHVLIPSSVTTIQRAAFVDNEIETVTFENSIETIGLYAFYDNKIKTVTVPFSWEVSDNVAFDPSETFGPGAVMVIAPERREKRKRTIH